MNKQKNKTISFVLIIIAAASITGLMTPSLGIDVQAEKEVENESSYNGNQHESSYNDNKYKHESSYNGNQHESSYNDNYASDEYSKYYDPKDKNVKIEVIKSDNSITNINVAESSQNQEPANVGVIDVFGVHYIYKK